MTSPYLPHEAEVVERRQESDSVFTLRLRFTDPRVHERYQFQPGQFNMLYLHGVGEVPISIVSDPEDEQLYDHAVRAVGRVTRGLSALKAGDRIGVRGPFGRGWPMDQLPGKDLLLVTGGLGCAPVVSVINYVMRRCDLYGRVVIMQGVKHSDDLIWRESYEQWQDCHNTQVLLAANEAGPGWPWATGLVTSLFEQAKFDASSCKALLCGPEGMMFAAIDELAKRGVPEPDIWLSMERNMQCAIGHCGHCQYGPRFVCKDGPVFCYPEIKGLHGVQGF